MPDPGTAEPLSAEEKDIAALIGITIEEQTAAAPPTDRPDLDELWHRDGAMVYITEGPGEDDSHFVADAASDDDAERFVDWHNQALASLAARLPAAREQAATEARQRPKCPACGWTHERRGDICPK